jgi:hypothetical protein
MRVFYHLFKELRSFVDLKKSRKVLLKIEKPGGFCREIKYLQSLVEQGLVGDNA